MKARIMVCYRRVPNLKDLLFKRRRFASKQGDEFGTYPCGSGRCRAYILMSRANSFKSTVTGQEFSTNIRAFCSTRSAIYLATCNFCAKQYVGNTTQALRSRITGHRNDSVLKARAIVHRDVFDNSFSFHVIC